SQMDSDTMPRLRWNAALPWLAALMAIGMVVAGALLLMRPALSEPRPVVLSVYCASSAAWMNTLAPFLDSAPDGDGKPDRGRVTSARIKSAYERRCTTSD